MSKQKKVSGSTGLERAAIFLLSLGPDISSKIMPQLDDDRLVDIAKRMPAIQDIETETLISIYKEFVQLHKAGDPFIGGEAANIEDMLRGVVDEERLQRIMESLEHGGPVKLPVWEKIARMKPNSVFSLIRNENPQAIAIILGRLDPEQASTLIELFPEESQMEIILRMAKLESVPGDVTRDIEEALDNLLGNQHGGGPSGFSFDGMVRVVEILKTLDSKVSKPILEHLREKDSAIFEQVDSQLLVFDDFDALSNKDIQQVLKQVSSEDLVRALKGASDELREKFLANMSQRAADVMREDMEVMGPIKVSDVEVSQRAILEVARKLDNEGVISLGNQEDMVA